MTVVFVFIIKIPTLTLLFIARFAKAVFTEIAMEFRKLGKIFYAENAKIRTKKRISSASYVQNSIYQ